MLITFEVKGRCIGCNDYEEDYDYEIEEYEMNIDPTQEEIIAYYGEMKEEEEYENDDDFIEWLMEEHQEEAQEAFDEGQELQSEYNAMANTLYYW